MWAWPFKPKPDFACESTEEINAWIYNLRSSLNREKEADERISAINDGGPAFPREDYQTANAGGQCGMSLRDYFAAKAMQAGLTGATLPGLDRGDPETVAAIHKVAAAFYVIADAMLKARAMEVK